MKALEEEWREETREILAGAFADAMGGLGGYRKYTSIQIGNYLKEHMNMPPLAVVLVGILSEPMCASRGLTPPYLTPLGLMLFWLQELMMIDTGS